MSAPAWGYRLGSVIAQVGYATLFFSTVGLFSTENRMVSAVAVSALTRLIFAVLSAG